MMNVFFNEMKIIFSLLLIGGLFYGSSSSAQETSLSPGQIQTEYFKSMAEVNDEIFKQKFEYPFLALLNESELTDYENLPTMNEKKEYIQLYWKINNPNPLLPENKRLNLFLARCTYVQYQYTFSKPPYFDDRGKYFLKYGMPQNRFQQKMDTKFVQLFSNPHVYDWVCNMSGPAASFSGSGGRIPRSYCVNENETWIYPSEDDDPNNTLIVHFIKRGDGFREVQKFDDIISNPGPLGHRIWYWSDLIKERAMVLGVKPFSDTVREIYELEGKIHFAATATANADTMELSYPVLTLSGIKFKNHRTVQWAKHQMPPSIYKDEITPNKLAFYHDAAQFRDSDGRTRVEFSLLSPIEDNLIKSTTDSLYIEYTCLLEDHLANPQIIDTLTSRLPANVEVQKELENAIGWMSLTSQPQKGGITLQVKDLETGEIGYQKQPIAIRDFSGAGLMISDIQLLSEVNDPALKRTLPVFEKKGRTVSPHLFPGIKSSWPVLCYFEIYNLIGGIPSGKYVLELYVERIRGRGLFNKLTAWMSDKEKARIGLSHTRIVGADTVQELISIDFSNLKPGEYTLEIAVKDALNEHLKTSVQKKISIERLSKHDGS